MTSSRIERRPRAPVPPMDREGGEISKSLGGEAELGAVEPEQLGVLFDQRVAGLRVSTRTRSTFV